MSRVFAIVFVLVATTGSAAPREAADACYVRTEAFQAMPAASASASASAALRAAESFVGIRRQSEKLAQLNILISGSNLVTCSLSGIAKWEGAPGQESLSMVVRPDAGQSGADKTKSLCKVSVQFREGGVHLSTSETSCRAQSLCGGKVELGGQEFASTMKLPPGASAPCFHPVPF